MRGSDSLYAYNFRFYFTPLPGVLFTFPSRYLFTIGHLTYLGLEGGPPSFRPDYTCPILLRILLRTYILFPYGAITHYGVTFQRLRINIHGRYRSPTTPRNAGFGLIPVRSSLLGESHLISFPQLLRYFSLLCFLYYAYVFSIEYQLLSITIL